MFHDYMRCSNNIIMKFCDTFRASGISYQFLQTCYLSEGTYIIDTFGYDVALLIPRPVYSA